MFIRFEVIHTPFELITFRRKWMFCVITPSSVTLWVNPYTRTRSSISCIYTILEIGTSIAITVWGVVMRTPIEIWTFFTCNWPRKGGAIKGRTMEFDFNINCWENCAVLLKSSYTQLDSNRIGSQGKVVIRLQSEIPVCHVRLWFTSSVKVGVAYFCQWNCFI